MTQWMLLKTAMERSSAKFIEDRQLEDAKKKPTHTIYLVNDVFHAQRAADNTNP